jgi:hypothetical protein
VEAAGQLFHLFRDGLDYAFILPHPNPLPEPVEGVDKKDAGRVIRFPDFRRPLSLTLSHKGRGDQK